MALDLQTGLPNLPQAPENSNGVMAWASNLTRTLYAMFTTLYTDLLNIKNSAFVETENIANLAITVDKLSSNVTALAYRVNTQESAGTLTPEIEDYDMYVLTALAEALTLANPVGTGTQGQKLIIRIKASGGDRVISYGTKYRGIGMTLTTPAVSGKTLYLGFIYNSTDDKYDLVASVQEA